MVISSKLSDVNGVEFIVSEDTDIDDVGGFSDPIQVVGAKTAKFSGGTTMQSNAGLRIGLTQVKINTGDATPPARTEVIADYVGWSANGNDVDDNFLTSLGAVTMSGTDNEAVIDYGSIAVRKLVLKVQCTALGTDFQGSQSQVTYAVSNDNITYGTFTQIANANRPPTGDMGGSVIVTSTVTFTDPGTQSFRYVKIIGHKILASGSNATTSDVFEATIADTGSTVTVKLRSSTALDTADGTILIDNQVMTLNDTLTFVNPYLLTGNPIGDFVTLEIVSLSNFDIPVTLSEITSIKEV